MKKRLITSSFTSAFLAFNLLFASLSSTIVTATEMIVSESQHSEQNIESQNETDYSETEDDSFPIESPESRDNPEEASKIIENDITEDTGDSIAVGEEAEDIEVAEAIVEEQIEVIDLPETVEDTQGFIDDPDMESAVVGHEGEFNYLDEYNREETYDLAMRMMYLDLEEKNLEPELVASTSYTPSRSNTGVAYIDNFFNTIIPYAIEDSISSGILPSITIAQGALESAWGQSGLTINANNLFGIKSSNDWRGEVYNVITKEYKAPEKNTSGKIIKQGYWYEVIAPFRKYSSWLGSIRDHGAFFTSTEWRKNNYRHVIGEKDYKKAAQALQDAGYATDPGYARKLISIIENYQLYKYDGVPIMKAEYHVQNHGWLSKVGSQLSLGHAGDDLRVEDFKFSFPTDKNMGINFSAHIQKRGWVNNISTGQTTGNVGKSMRMEAVKLSLTGEAAKSFDIFYRVYSDTIGWSGWAKNGSPAGSEGYAKKIRSLEIIISWKNQNPVSISNTAFKVYSNPNVNYSSHVQSIGWMSSVANGKMTGTSGRALRLEAMKINLSSQPYSGSIAYQTHVQDHGWMKSVSNGDLTGTVGKSKRLEAIKITLTGTMSQEFDIYYRTHIQTYGWTGWAKNGQPSGSEGLGRRLEAMEVRLVKKGNKAPGTTNRTFYR